MQKSIESLAIVSWRAMDDFTHWRMTADQMFGIFRLAIHMNEEESAEMAGFLIELAWERALMCK